MSYRRSEWDVLRPVLFFLAAILWLEGVYRAFYVDGFFARGLIHILLFTLPMAAGCAVLSSLLSKRGNRVVALVLTSLITLWFMIQSVYQTIFHTVLVTNSFNMAGQALGSYWRETLSGIWRTMPVLLLLALPLVGLIVGRRLTIPRQADGRAILALVAAAVVFQIGGTLSLMVPTGGLMSMREIYRQSFIPDMTVSNFGLLTTLRLDITQGIFGLEEGEIPVDKPDVPAPDASASTSQGGDVSTPPEEVPVVYGPNVMDIDFDALIAGESDDTLKKMHEYFRDKEPTLKNEYTGMFQGKNLIFMTAEAFWIGCVSEKYTPTLYKLANSGFVFENFYNPLWYYSTVDGEYAHTTGLIPTNQVNASQRYAGKNKVDMYFTMGNQLRAAGYPTLAYHNNTAKYYDRHLSHPNLGYDYYAGDTGLDVKMSWPQSDLEMMELTLPQALAGQLPFHNYYMTVSGHMNYNFMGNMMAKKHQEEVADMEGFTDDAKAYMACNMELDRALEYTLKTLEEAGQLENTVIAISGDHYPYGLDGTGAIDQLTSPGTEADEWEKYRSTLILWSGSMEEPVVIEKPCYSIDVIPTLSNLFGLEYDSRLLAGRDILSDAPGLVVFNNKSFITELGRYSAKQDKFFPNEGAVVPEGYASEMYQQAKNAMLYSERILFNDYYRKIGLEH